MIAATAVWLIVIVCIHDQRFLAEKSANGTILIMFFTSSDIPSEKNGRFLAVKIRKVIMFFTDTPCFRTVKS